MRRAMIAALVQPQGQEMAAASPDVTDSSASAPVPPGGANPPGGAAPPAGPVPLPHGAAAAPSHAAPDVARAPHYPEAPLWARLTRRMTEYARLTRLDRPIGTWL